MDLLIGLNKPDMGAIVNGADWQQYLRYYKSGVLRSTGYNIKECFDYIENVVLKVI